MATATSIFALSLYTAVGAFTHMAFGNVSPGTALAAGAGIVVGAQVSARLSRWFSVPWVLRLLALGLLALGVRLLLQGVRGPV